MPSSQKYITSFRLQSLYTTLIKQVTKPPLNLAVAVQVEARMLDINDQ
jgi:hypothetical protein